jgi:hypothetical protein
MVSATRVPNKPTTYDGHDGLVVTSLPKVPIWKGRYFNGLRFTQYGNILI